MRENFLFHVKILLEVYQSFKDLNENEFIISGKCVGGGKTSLVPRTNWQIA
jgi:hypothetical protein